MMNSRLPFPALRRMLPDRPRRRVLAIASHAILTTLVVIAVVAGVVAANVLFS